MMFPSRVLIPIALLLGYLNVISGKQQLSLEDTTPLFFYCKQYDRLQPLKQNWDLSSMKSTKVEVAGNPRSYVSGQVYRVTVRLPEEFETSMVTGVYSAVSAGNPVTKQKQKIPYQRKTCTVLHSSTKQRPSARLDFLWIAPPEDMGCIDFVGTFTRQDLVLMKDEWIYHLCPATPGEQTSERLTLSGIDQEGIVFRDDFESGELSPSLWSRFEGFTISNSCEPILHGLSASICKQKEEFTETVPTVHISTVALNTTTAGILQFSIGRIFCLANQVDDTNSTVNVTLLYGQLALPHDNECSGWTPLRTITLPKNKELGLYHIPLPSRVRNPETCLQWSIQATGSFCLGIDDVILTNRANRPFELHADFDPINSFDWLSLTGGYTHHGCKGSKGSAIAFHSNQRGPVWASTRDLELRSYVKPTEEELLWKPDFDKLLPSEPWEFEHARINDGCDDSKRHLVIQLSPNSSVPSACSPPLDLSKAGNLRFHLEPPRQCKKETKAIKGFTSPEKRHPGKLNVWIERHDQNHKKVTILSGLALIEDSISSSLPIPSEGQVNEGRICWQLLNQIASEIASPWAVDDIAVLTPLPSPVENILQFRLNMDCEHDVHNVSVGQDNSFHITVQYSTNEGSSWNSLHDLCLPPWCSGILSSVIETSWSSQEVMTRAWERITLPLPFASLSEYARFRFIQKGKGGTNSARQWALDDIHLENCHLGCNGHGTCVQKGLCSCDEGYQGEWCQQPVRQLQLDLRENFEVEEEIFKTFSRFIGHHIGMNCGKVGAGLAAIFDQPGVRQLVTVDMDTTASQTLRFALRINGPGSRLHYHCPGPDRSVESIYVHSSCNGGITWSLLKYIQPYHSKEEPAQLIRIHLTDDARGPSCRFKIWQAQHSGSGKDIWAVDDIYIGPHLNDTLVRNSTGILLQTVPDAFVGRHTPEEFCKRNGVMALQGNEIEETYPVRVEPFSVVQLEVAVGCSASTPVLNNNTVVIQFSVDGGKHWIDLEESRRHVSLLQVWRRFGVKLPPESWSKATRFRIAQTGRLSDRDTLAIDYFYVGPDECPELCRANGRCSLSGCVCDTGFHGLNCLPNVPISSLRAGNQNSTVLIGGADYLADRDGCLVRGTRNMIFDVAGMRSVETKEIEYSSGMSVLFFLRLGDCDTLHMSSYDIHVQLEISWDGGGHWTQLREYRSPFFVQPQLQKVDIPPPNAIVVLPFKIRFIQSGVHAKDRNVWSLAGLTTSSQEAILLASSIADMKQPLVENDDLWLVRNEPDPKEACLVFNVNCLGGIAWYGTLTNEIFLNIGDSVQFDIVAQPSDSAAFPDTAEQIFFEYTADGGLTWHLVQPECLHSWSNCPGFVQSSRIDYRSLKSPVDGKEDRFHFHTSEAMANKPILLRWLHHRLSDQKNHPLRGFRIENLYIGVACPSLCSGHGKCWNSVCTCEVGYSGDDCSEFSGDLRSLGFYDTFPYEEHAESKTRLSSHWSRIIGGQLMPNYCDGYTDGVVFFGSRGPRSLQTKEMDSRSLRLIQFTIAVTSVPIYKQNCRHTAKRKSLPGDIPVASLLILDYSNDNGLTWHVLESWPMNMEADEKRLTVVLPPSARTAATVFRWWQLTHPNAKNRDGLQWYLDDVLVNLNVTNPTTFEYELEQSIQPYALQQLNSDDPSTTNPSSVIENWLGWQGLGFREPLYPVNTMLKSFQPEESSTLSYAETWDMEIIDPTFAQFQLMLPPNSHPGSVEIRFEYSTDMGRRWSLVESECYRLYQLTKECDYLHPPSRYLLRNENNATRITVYLPKRSITESTRFRWINENTQERVPIGWGVGHVYIGSACPWMCSGHGTCHNGHCNCDAGYGNQDCVPIDPLPKSLVSHFDVQLEMNKVRLSGGTIGSGCGILMSGLSAVFHEDGLRYFESTDLDLTVGSYAQMTVKFNCWAETESFMHSAESSHHRLLLQYSVNGGITWILIQEVKFQPQHDPQLLIINLMRLPDLTNCTRIRLWQPVHAGEGWDTWAVDGLVVHSIIPVGEIQSSYFEQFNAKSDWLTWFGGSIQSFCLRDNALVFDGELGAQQLLTGDSMLTEESVLQFEVNVGCGTTDPNLEYPVRLEYSNDGGQTWRLVVNDQLNQNPYNRVPNQVPTIYSSETTNVWRRETVSLSHLETSKAIRFRWFQGYLNRTDGHLAPRWAIRNVILSPYCPEMCNGHGRCTKEGTCECDNGYVGHLCDTVSDPNPQDFHESFEEDLLKKSLWLRVIGGKHRASSASNVGFGGEYVFDGYGHKILETRDLNLANANFVQFYIDSSESLLPEDDSFVLLEYSINGGIEWTITEAFPLSQPKNQELIQVPLPNRAMSMACRLKWSELSSRNTSSHTVWAIDEVYIGGDYYAKAFIEDSFQSVNRSKESWLFVSGGTLEPSCGSTESTLHFTDHNGKSILMTKDVKVVDEMYLKYETSTGCTHPRACNRVRLEYSDNYGLVWRSLSEECLPGEEVNCNAFQLHTELLSRATGYRRTITLPFPVTKGVIRFRWTSNDEPEYDWSLHWVYAGAACGDCNGRGRCWKGSCLCRPNWIGETCEKPLIQLPFSIRETFDDRWSTTLWSRINGGQVTSLCGTLDHGQALHFHEACDRYAETKELELRGVRVIQFHLRSGCGQTSIESEQGTLLFQYSLNGGVKWHNGLFLSLNQFQEPRLVSFIVPPEAQTHATKLRWWQHERLGYIPVDWAIDSLIIDNPLNVSSSAGYTKLTEKQAIKADKKFQADQPIQLIKRPQNVLQDNFGQRLWWRKINVERVESFCGRRGNVMRGRSNTVEESILETSDFFVENTIGRTFSFDIIVGDCTHTVSNESTTLTSIKYPVRFEVSYDHGISWNLYHTLKVRGENGQGPQVPSIYVKLDKWHTYQYSLELLSGAVFARFRWRHPRSPVPVFWAVYDIDIAAKIVDNLAQSGLRPLVDDFNEGTIAKIHWKFFTGGKIVMPIERLGDGAAGLFKGPGLKILQTTELDLTFGKYVEFVLHFQLPKGRRDHYDFFQNVFLQCSSDNGFTWSLIEEYLPQMYTTPTVLQAILPETCQSLHSILRWWQPIDMESSYDTGKKTPVWMIDNVVIEYANQQLMEIYDSFRMEAINETQWQFYPNGFISNNMCGILEKENSLNFVTNEDTRFVGITTKHIVIKKNYAVYFKIKTSCGSVGCQENNRSEIRFEMRQNFNQPSWSLVQPHCLPSSMQTSCDPQIFHSSSAYKLGIFPLWHRIIIPLTPVPYANIWQFRWTAPQIGRGGKNKWAIKDVYIGQMCPYHCHNHGDCIRGKCHCDNGYDGPSCSVSKSVLPNSLPIVDHFDDVSASLWESITGGSIKVGCGSFIPYAHGKHLHFDECGIRMATTVPMDASKVRRVAFVIRIGTPQQIPSCRIQPTNMYGSETLDRTVLLQYSNNGVDWFLIASHGIRNFVQPQRLIYNIPSQNNSYTIQVRWWQPLHGGANWDQWALDNVLSELKYAPSSTPMFLVHASNVPIGILYRMSEEHPNYPS